MANALSSWNHQITRPKTLIINRFDSKCGDCGHSADPHEGAHLSILGHRPERGCGSKWDKVTSDYANMDKYLINLRPDLDLISTDV